MPRGKSTVSTKKTQIDYTTGKVDRNKMFCSFCGRSAENAYRFIAALEKKASICDECVSIIVKILHDEGNYSLPPIISKTAVLIELLGKGRYLLPLPHGQPKGLEMLFIAPKTELTDFIFNDQIMPLAAKHQVTITAITPLSNSSVEKITEEINNAFLIIADVSRNDPDVMFLLGIIHILRKPLVLLTQNINKNPRHLRDACYIEYRKSSSSLSRMSSKLELFFENIHNFNDILLYDKPEIEIIERKK